MAEISIIVPGGINEVGSGPFTFPDLGGTPAVLLTGTPSSIESDDSLITFTFMADELA